MALQAEGKVVTQAHLSLAERVTAHSQNLRTALVVEDGGGEFVKPPAVVANTERPSGGEGLGRRVEKECEIEVGWVPRVLCGNGGREMIKALG